MGLNTVSSPWFFVLLLKSLPWSISPKLPPLRISVVGENGRGWSYREVKHDKKNSTICSLHEISPDNSGSSLKDHGPWILLEIAICAGTKRFGKWSQVCQNVDHNTRSWDRRCCRGGQFLTLSWSKGLVKSWSQWHTKACQTTSLKH